MPGIELSSPFSSASSKTRSFSQRDVGSMFGNNSKDAFIKLTRTVYELAMNPTLPLNQFTTLVKVQQQNGVRLSSRYVDLVLNSCINYSNGIKLLSIVLPDYSYFVQGF